MPESVGGMWSMVLLECASDEMYSKLCANQMQVLCVERGKYCMTMNWYWLYTRTTENKLYLMIWYL